MDNKWIKLDSIAISNQLKAPSSNIPEEKDTYSSISCTWKKSVNNFLKYSSSACICAVISLLKSISMSEPSPSTNATVRCANRALRRLSHTIRMAKDEGSLQICRLGSLSCDRIHCAMAWKQASTLISPLTGSGKELCATNIPWQRSSNVDALSITYVTALSMLRKISSSEENVGEDAVLCGERATAWTLNTNTVLWT